LTILKPNFKGRMKNYLRNWNDFLDKVVTLLMEDPIKVKNLNIIGFYLFNKIFSLESP